MVNMLPAAASSVAKDKMTKRMGNAVFFIRESDKVGGFFYLRYRVIHSDADCGCLNDVEIVLRISDRKRFLLRDIQVAA